MKRKPISGSYMKSCLLIGRSYSQIFDEHPSIQR